MKGYFLSIEQKTAKLNALVHAYARVAVAFSGGVDSSFLLKSTLAVLGAGNVLVLYCRSCLTSQAEQQRAETWPARHGLAGIDFLPIDIQPLSWKEFVENTERRCYFCKLRMYKEFLAVMHRYDLQILLDGTNIDDLKHRRPGLQAIHELGVRTPLVDAGFDKNEIRNCSRQMNLDTWNIPSSSCLATRIPHGRAITGERLQKIADYEDGLAGLGFSGCRVRLHSLRDDAVILQLQQHDFDRLALPGMRLAIIRFFQKSGLRDIFLDLQGRDK